jgi:hypothetical protein
LIAAGTYAKDGGSFEGKWVLDKGQSTATSGIPDGLEEQIKNKGSEMVIESKWKEPADGMAPMVLLGVMTTELKLKTDGSQTETRIGPFQGATTTKQDGSAMLTNWQTQANGQPVSGQWTRTLSPDGKTMTLDIKQTSDGKDGTAKLVFRRK